jgi:exosortase K
MNQRINWGAQLFAVLLCALGLKHFYSTASANELRWILAPTTVLVELLSGSQFAFESYAGYMSSDRRFLIAASCAGVNFLLMSFLLLSLRYLWSKRNGRSSWRFIPIVAVVAYVTTVFANTIRICIALELQRHPLQNDWLNASQIHRIEGIVVYFGFLVFLFVLTEKWNSMTTGRLLKLSIFPLAVYYATTLGLPILNGALKQGFPFLEHAFFVMVTPLFLVVLVAVGMLLKSGVRFRSKVVNRHTELEVAGVE